MVIGYTILINQLVFHFLDVYIPMLHPLFSPIFPGLSWLLPPWPSSQEAKRHLRRCAASTWKPSKVRCAVDAMDFTGKHQVEGKKKHFFPGKHQEHLGRLGDFSPSNTGVWSFKKGYFTVIVIFFWTVQGALSGSMYLLDAFGLVGWRRIRIWLRKWLMMNAFTLW